MKRLLTLTVVLLLLLGVCGSTAIAADITILFDDSMSFSFSLGVNGSSLAAAIAPGDTLTLEIRASRTDQNTGFRVYSLDTQTVYDGGYFELVDGSLRMTEFPSLGSGHAFWDMSGTGKRVDMGYYSSSLLGEEIQGASVIVGTFRLKARQLPEGVDKMTTKLSLQNCYFGTFDGMARYLTDSQGSIEVTITRPTGGTDPDIEPGTDPGAAPDIRPPGTADQRTSETTMSDMETPLAGARFSDVPDDHWAFKYIEYLAALGIVTGYPDGTFAPSSHITRAEFVTILARMSGDDLAAGYSGPFTDIAMGSYYGNAVAWAVSKGVTQGTSKTAFSPNAPITREQMAAMLTRYATGRGYVFELLNDPADFSDDAKISGYAKEPVKVMQQADIINGYEDGSFRPQGSATRAESAKLIALLHDLMNGD